jgi:hypothetical protein
LKNPVQKSSQKIRLENPVGKSSWKIWQGLSALFSAVRKGLAFLVFKFGKFWEMGKQTAREPLSIRYEKSLPNA